VVRAAGARRARFHSSQPLLLPFIHPRALSIRRGRVPRPTLVGFGALSGVMMWV